MAKIESLSNSVKVGNIEFPKNVLSFDEEGDLIVILREGDVIVKGEFGDYRDNTDTPYASKSALITALRAAFFA